MRRGLDVFRDALNSPAFFAMLPPVRGLHGLDVGCGEGANTRQLARLGARMVAIDVAPTFIRHAEDVEKTVPLGVDYRLADAMALPFEPSSFDFATAFMSLLGIQTRAVPYARSVESFAGACSARSKKPNAKSHLGHRPGPREGP